VEDVVRRAGIRLVLACLALLTACTGPAASVPGPAGLPRVLATETFLADIAQNVAGGRLSVDSLLPRGIDPHEFQPAPQDAIRIAQSQVLIINGLGYETWLDKLLQSDQAGGISVLVASDGLAPGGSISSVQAATDPHMWMDPVKVVHYAENIRDGLSQADPAGATEYAANTDAYGVKLQALDSWIRGEVAKIPPERRLLVTNHDALGYFAAAYGFKLIGAVIPSVTSEASPSPQEMAALIQTIKSSGAPAIFLDVSENQKLASQISAESGARVVTGLYIETLSSSGGPATTYIEMMKYDVTLIVQALE
jgi:ABC-type Zn uptake system ZnuABC Zn-binding protein ZnuA